MDDMPENGSFFSLMMALFIFLFILFDLNTDDVVYMRVALFLSLHSKTIWYNDGLYN